MLRCMCRYVWHGYDDAVCMECACDECRLDIGCMYATSFGLVWHQVLAWLGMKLGDFWTCGAIFEDSVVIMTWRWTRLGDLEEK